MRKFIGITILLFSIASCEKDEYTSYRQEANVSNIIDVNLSLNSSALIGDGKAELTFKVKAFSEVRDTRKVEVKKGDEIIIKDSTFVKYIEINYDRLDQKELAIFKEDGTKLDFKFTTTENIGDSVAFYAVYKGVKSKIRKVKIIEKPVENFKPIVVPVIFHIIYKKSDAFLFENITPEYLQKKLDRLNNVFAGKEYPNAPSTIDTKVSFELATHDQNGKLLAMKGMSVSVVDTEYPIGSYIDKNKTKYIWDLNHYLNVWIHDDADVYSLNVQLPKYILNNGSHLEMDAWDKLRVVDTPQDANYYQHVEVGIEMHQSYLYRTDDLSFACDTRLETHFGIFYGLVTTSYMPPWSGAATDFCSDTHTYFSRFRRPEKWTFVASATNAERKNGDEMYYDSFNIMDEMSRCSTISYEQALRIRTVVENCPFRMMKKE